MTRSVSKYHQGKLKIHSTLHVKSLNVQQLSCTTHKKVLNRNIYSIQKTLQHPMPSCFNVQSSNLQSFLLDTYGLYKYMEGEGNKKLRNKEKFDT